MEDSIIIGSQVSLSRNITNYPFPHKLSQSESQVITDKVNNIILESEDLFQENFILYRIKDISNIEKDTLIDRGIISNKFSTNEVGAIIINKDKTKCILINDEDHIKIKVYEDQFNVDEAFNFAKKVLSTNGCDLLILDEILGVLDVGVITVDDLKCLLDAKEEDTTIIMTGIQLKDEVVSLVDEISKIESMPIA